LNNQSRSRIKCYVEQWLIDKVKEQQQQQDRESREVDFNLDHLNLFSAKDEYLKKKISYMVTLGGDGTILYGAK
jgi:NAD kinase